MSDATATDGGRRPPESMGGGLRFLRGGAFLVIFLGGLKVAGDLLTPIIVAAFVAIVCVPAVEFLKKRHVPGGLAVVLVLVLVLGAILLVSIAVVDSATDFASQRGVYEAALKEKVANFTAWLQGMGIELAEPKDPEPLDPRKLLSTVGSMVGTVADVFSNVFLVLLIVVFMLLEASGLPAKIQRAMGDRDADLSQFEEIGAQVWQYLGIKTWLSLLTGVAWGVLVAAVGIEYAILWGLLAFLLNFIPNIGSLLAAIPPVVLALITRDLTTALILVGGNLVINQVLGNVVEPRVMGSRLGLSPLVVFLSLLFWGWLWGPVGMLLSVPLTMIAKIMFENSEDLKPVAIMLGPCQAPKTG